MSKKEIAVQDESGMFPTVAPDFINKESMRGSEDVSSDDLTIPRLQIVQDLSPQHKKTKPEYIEGAVPGVCFNTATKKLYGNSIFVVPVYFRKEWVLWKDIDSGGGFGGSFDNELEAAQAKAAQEQPDLWVSQDTHQQFCLVVDPTSDMANPVVEEIVISMSVSQMKPSRSWNTMIRSLGGDRFSRVYKLQVVEATNKNNQDYYNYKIDHVGFVSEPLFKAAESMYEAVKQGQRDVSRATDAPPQTSGPTDADILDADEFAD
jgi:hypothetical protein